MQSRSSRPVSSTNGPRARTVRPTNRNKTSITKPFRTATPLVFVSSRTHVKLALVAWNDCRMDLSIYPVSWVEGMPERTPYLNAMAEISQRKHGTGNLEGAHVRMMIPALTLRLAASVPRGAERLVFVPVDRSSLTAPLKAGQFLWVSADREDWKELRIILEVGERYVQMAPLEDRHAAATIVCRPPQLRLAHGHYRLGVD